MKGILFYSKRVVWKNILPFAEMIVKIRLIKLNETTSKCLILNA
jgi:hypothetical protein